MIHPEHHGADRSVAGNSAPVAQGGDATIHDRTGLYLAVLALIISALCLGLFLMQTFLMPQIIDAKIQAGGAKTEALANEARINARVAVDEIERMRTALAAKGIIIPKPEH